MRNVLHLWVWISMLFKLAEFVIVTLSYTVPTQCLWMDGFWKLLLSSYKRHLWSVTGYDKLPDEDQPGNTAIENEACTKWMAVCTVEVTFASVLGTIHGTDWMYCSNRGLQVRPLQITNEPQEGIIGLVFTRTNPHDEITTFSSVCVYLT